MNRISLIIVTYFLSISDENGHFHYPLLSKDFEWKPPTENGFNLSSIDQLLHEKKFSYI